MAANYWTSTHHRHWTFTRQKLASLRAGLDASNPTLVAQFPLPDQRLISIFFRDQLIKLARRLPTRQPILSTTLLYLSRYWLLRPIRTTNPFLLLATCFYLASKTEELPHHIRLVLTEAKNLWPEYIPGDVFRMGECEFEVISALRSQLIVFHPYTLVGELSGRGDQYPDANSGGNGRGLGVGISMQNAFPSSSYGFGQNQGYGSNHSSQSHSQGYNSQDQSDGSNQPKKWNLNLTQEETAMAWSIVNDSYLTDLPLTQPPHVIAIMAIFLAVVFQPSRAPGLNLHSVSGSQQQQQQNSQQFSLGNTGNGIGTSIVPPPTHALPPKPLTHASSSNSTPTGTSLGGSRSIASALRASVSVTSSPQSMSNNNSQSASTGGKLQGQSQGNAAAATIPSTPKIEAMISFLAESEIDIEKVIEATQEVISLYEVWESYSEKMVKEALGRIVKGRGMDK